MDEEKFSQLFTSSIPIITNKDDSLTMSRALLDDFKRYAARDERNNIIKFLEDLEENSNQISLSGAIALLKNKGDSIDKTA
jgi:hypothetical protein